MTLKSDIQPQSTHEKAAIVSGEMVNPHGDPLSKAVTLIDRFKVPGSVQRPVGRFRVCIWRLFLQADHRREH